MTDLNEVGQCFEVGGSRASLERDEMIEYDEIHLVRDMREELVAQPSLWS